MLSLRFILWILGVVISSYQVLAKTATPELYGAIGDGIADDTKAIVAALQNNESVVLSKEYKVGYLIIPKGKRLVGKDSAILHYFAIDVAEDCTLEKLRFDGGWSTRGVQILGNNVTINHCEFVNTKGTLENYGGLTSAIWIGKYQDLDEKTIKYEKIIIKNCMFSQCEPYDCVSEVSNNKTVARYILSYGCNDLRITGCIFKGIKGTYDSDAIQLCSFSLEADKFPFKCYNDSWTGQKSPYLGFLYSPCNVIIEKCTFEQAKNKSSIKIMSSGVKVLKNNFILLNNDYSDPCYSMVRMHFVKNVLVKNNTFILPGSATNSVIKIGNCQNVVVERNSFTSTKQSNTSPIVLDATYTSECVFKKNTISFKTMENLLALEYNDSLIIKNNIIEVTRIESDTFRLLSAPSNHYSYPPSTYRGSKIENNRFFIKNWTGNTFDISNNYDFPISFNSNKIKKNGLKENIKIHNNGQR